MSSTSYSVFIPRVFLNISSTRISNVFHKLNIGEVDHVDLVKRSNEKSSFNMAFVHFKNMYDSNEARSFQDDVANPDTKAKIVYDDPWYWFVMPFTKKEKANQGFNSLAPGQGFVPPALTQPAMMVPPSPGMMLFWSHGPQGPFYYWGFPNPNVNNQMFTPNHQSFSQGAPITPSKQKRTFKSYKNHNDRIINKTKDPVKRNLNEELNSEQDFPSLEESKNVTVRSKKMSDWAAEDEDEED